jgi:hypothetical protein
MATELSTAYRAPATARRMAEAARAFLETLSEAQMPHAHFPFDGDERYFWHYTPTLRSGLLIKVMSPPQRRAAMALMDSGLSERGAAEVRRIMALEPILLRHEWADNVLMPWIRDQEMYYFSVYGEPGGAQPWGWKVGGHHIGLHYTVVDGKLISPLPLFFGANPAQVRLGPEAGERTLSAEEDLGRGLLQSMDAERKATAIVDGVAPDDILTKNYRTADPSAAPRGLALAAMSDPQRERLVRLIRHYVDRSSAELAEGEWGKLRAAGLDDTTFAWAGPEERAPGNGHYYAIRGRTFLIEYDNTQNNANHIHSVWRDFTNDWGEDLLAAHYAGSHRG